ncbi:NAD(P)/FAD-dependent oxidoreductase [Arthrobacter russicus]|uniref:NAD/FAD-binding protein n=1 Tax=Arthrobacter russicus TaxID=172040 RepID=A0ABU1J6K0_9MICC|nr:FAD-dependent oxidoreductase [Arthrobacter russicus]MDN5667863.1 FAD-dependent oxidoreductase [Renibacterium salmoninarum]MDR6268053.1 putative NAD/FAD-binding protein [Arthrobacter russicus]
MANDQRISETGDVRAPRSIAVVGSGISGLVAAWMLSSTDRVTLFEADDRLGGHAHTHELADGTPVDSGFIVYNERTYPTLIRLFEQLEVPTKPSDMSMSVKCAGCGLEYAGAKGFSGLFPGWRSFAKPRYLRMLGEVLRFHRRARALLASAGDDLTLGEFLEAEKFSQYFQSHFMTPVVSAVWSCDASTALDYPARYLFTFLSHHGMLAVKGSPKWRTVDGGSHEYVRRVAKSITRIKLGAKVTSLEEFRSGVRLGWTEEGVAQTEDFAAVVLATHPDQAAAILGRNGNTEQRRVLGAIPYSSNETLLHSDENVLPGAARARASWNYYLPDCSAQPENVLVSYDLSRLQSLDYPGGRLLVSLGEADRIADSGVLARMRYEHPQYSPASLAAQAELAAICTSKVVFAGAYHGWGFHEDGALSGYRAAQRLGGSWPV